MKLRIIKKSFHFRCQYKKYGIWWNFKDRTLNPRSNLNIWFGQFTPADKWMRNYIVDNFNKATTIYREYETYE